MKKRRDVEQLLLIGAVWGALSTLFADPTVQSNHYFANRSWRVVEELVETAPEDSTTYPPFELHFEDGRYSAYAGCNRMGGNYTQTADSIRFGPGFSTMMFCSGLMEREKQLLQLLQTVVRWSPVDSTHLQLWKKNGEQAALLRSTL